MTPDEINGLIIIGFCVVVSLAYIYTYGAKGFWKNLF
jgi:hypothetical protein